MTNPKNTQNPQSSKLKKQYIRMSICLALLSLDVLLIVLFAAWEDPPEALAWLTVFGFAAILPLIGLTIFHAVRLSSIKRELAAESTGGMTRQEYNNIRSDFIKTVGIFMLALGIFTAAFGGLHTKMVHDHSTAVAIGKVVGEKIETEDNGKEVRKVQISYTLPDGDWLVFYESDLEVGAEVSVYYNPDNPEEKYIEGLEESPFYYVFIGLFGVALGVVAIVISRLTKKKPEINDMIDLADRSS